MPDCCEVKGSHDAGLGTLRGTGVVAHWGYAYPIAQGDAADLDGCEERWGGVAGIFGGSGTDCVFGREVFDAGDRRIWVRW